MPTPVESAHPIQTLREQVTAIEAAITLALADPKPKPVHRLRTTSRRIEAQMALIGLLPELPDHAKAAAKAAKLLRKLRRAAGSVRDLDVQGESLEAYIGKPAAPEQGNAPASELRDDVRKEAKALLKILKRERKAEAEDLVELLEKRQGKISLALEDLLKALEPAESLALAPGELSALTRRWYTHNTPAEPGIPDDPDELHAIRKSAKLARYIAESAPGGEAGGQARKGAGQDPSGLARDFESLQEAGGEWHDLLTLAEIARKHTGKRSALSQLLEQQRDQALEAYQRQLRNPPV